MASNNTGEFDADLDVGKVVCQLGDSARIERGTVEN